MVAKSNSERQAAFRARRSRDAREVQLWLGDSEKLKLARLARHWGISQAEVVARLVRRADEEVVAGLDDAAFEAYLR